MKKVDGFSSTVKAMKFKSHLSAHEKCFMVMQPGKIMIIYEITAVVRADLIEKYEEYMRGRHIPDLLETGYFRAASFTRSGKDRYRIRYEAHDQAALDQYLKNEAERLRADFLEHFPEGIELTRDVWEVLEVWKKT